MGILNWFVQSHLVASLELRTFYRHELGPIGGPTGTLGVKGLDLAAYDAVGPPVVESVWVVDPPGISKGKLLTIVIPEVIEHSLFQLFDQYYKRALAGIERRLLEGPVRVQKQDTDQVRAETKVEVKFGKVPFTWVDAKFPMDRWYGHTVFVPDTALAFFDEQFPVLNADQQSKVLEILSEGLRIWKLGKPSVIKATWDWMDWIDYSTWIQEVSGDFKIGRIPAPWRYRRFNLDDLGVSFEEWDFLQPHRTKDSVTGLPIVLFLLPNSERVMLIATAIPRLTEPSDPKRFAQVLLEFVSRILSLANIRFRESPRYLTVRAQPALVFESDLISALPNVDPEFFIAAAIQRPDQSWIGLFWMARWSTRGALRERIDRILTSLQVY